MKKSERQQLFALNFSKLIQYVFEQGWSVVIGEVQRPLEMQEIYFKNGKSKTMDSQHLDKMAGDLFLFIDGEIRWDAESYKPLADYWESLHPDNVAGYRWINKQGKRWDPYHFEMKD
jgi:hypothetical protein